MTNEWMRYIPRFLVFPALVVLAITNAFRNLLVAHANYHV